MPNQCYNRSNHEMRFKMNKILILIDSFKSTLDSNTLGLVMKEALENLNIKAHYYPISDGGEGFLDAVNFKMNKKVEDITITDLDGCMRKTYYLRNNDSAYVEVALLLGFAGFKASTDILSFNSKALGEVIKDIYHKGIKHMTIGLGGSLTNDFGCGMLEALGVKFYNHDDQEIKHITPIKLNAIKSVDLSPLETYKDLCITIASDVTNPLFGKFGATEVFSRQKGASEDDVLLLEEAGMHFYEVLLNENIKDCRNTPGVGAAGGLGFALVAMFNSRILSGIDYVIESLDIKEDYCAVITGEGKVDDQSFNGKVCFAVANHFKLPVYIVSAINNVDLETLKDFPNVKRIYSIVPDLATKSESLDKPLYYFKELSKMVSKDVLKETPK